MKKTFTFYFKHSYWSYIMLIMMIMSTLNALATDSVVQGQVSAKEDKSSLPGVSVIVKGTSTGTTTDSRGTFNV